LLSEIIAFCSSCTDINITEYLIHNDNIIVFITIIKQEYIILSAGYNTIFDNSVVAFLDHPVFYRFFCQQINLFKAWKKFLSSKINRQAVGYDNRTIIQIKFSEISLSLGNKNTTTY